MNAGAAVLLLLLTVGIGLAIRFKKLSITALMACGSWGLLVGSTQIGATVSGMLTNLGSWLQGMPK